MGELCEIGLSVDGGPVQLLVQDFVFSLKK